MRVIAPIPKQFEDSNGVPYANGKVTVYLHNSTSLAQIYKEAEGGTLAPNPTILDSHGAWNAFVNGGTAYDYVVQDEHDNVIFSYSNVKANVGGGGGGMSPSILVARSSTYITGDDDAVSQNFTFTEVNKIGDDVYVDDGKVKCKKGTYKVSITIDIAVNPTNPKRPWTEQVTCNYYNSGYATYLIDRKIDEPHSANTGTIEFIAVVSSDDTELPVSLVGLGTGCYASVVQYGINKIAEDE